MVFSDRTADFRQATEECRKTTPEAKRPKSKPGPRRRAESGQTSDMAWGDAFLSEAYTILQHITTLNRMLASIRRPYLNVDSNSHSARLQPSRTLNLSGKEAWNSIKRLTNQERDEIDLQAKVILTRCSERVKQMEALEEKRASLAPNRNAIIRLLPARLTQTNDTAKSDLIAAHRSGVTWYLNRRLAEASNAQRELQEERVKRQLERAKSLGSTAGKDFSMSMTDSRMSNGLNASEDFSATQRFDPSLANRGSGFQSASHVSEADDEALELTQSQILQFEQENESILRSAENVLSAVRKAEESLFEIGALQTELVHHLTLQTEMTDKLYEEAMTTQAEVEKGNTQLKKAKERGGDARLWMLAFLFGASLALLFLHNF